MHYCVYLCTASWICQLSKSTLRKPKAERVRSRLVDSNRVEVSPIGAKKVQL